MNRKSDFSKSDYEVRQITQADCAGFVRAHHYAGTCAHVSTYRFGLYRRGGSVLLGIAMWLPLTRRAAEAVDRTRWQQVLSLTRMAVAPGVPKNACSFILSKSIRVMKSERRFVSFVTYADTAEGHNGHVYVASGWQPFGDSKATDRWRNPKTGTLVSQLSTKTRKVSDMLALGYVREGKSVKRRFVLYTGNDLLSKLLRYSVELHNLAGAMKR